MEGSLTAEDMRILSEWAVDSTDGTDSDHQQIVAVPIDDDATLRRSPAAPRCSRKKQRATYLRTREAKEGLRDEIAALEARLTTLKRRAGLDGERTNIEQMAVQHAVVRGILHQQHMMMAGAHAMLAKRLNVQATHPLYTMVYLSKDWESRRRTVISMRGTKLRNATQYLTERSRDLDELLPHSSRNVTQDEDGNIVCSEFNVVQLSNVKSLRQVFDAIHYFFAHEEIVLSERLGFLAIRDDFDVIDGIAANNRLYWIDGNGVITEWNSISYANIVGEEYAVLTSDSVDVDERYPFQPATRVRRAWSGGVLLSIAKKSEENSLIVVMRRASITKLHLPIFPLTAEMKESLIKSVFGWSDAMLTSIRSQLSS